MKRWVLTTTVSSDKAIKLRPRTITNAILHAISRTHEGREAGIAVDEVVITEQTEATAEERPEALVAQ